MNLVMFCLYAAYIGIQLRDIRFGPRKAFTGIADLIQIKPWNLYAAVHANRITVIGIVSCILYIQRAS